MIEVPQVLSGLAAICAIGFGFKKDRAARRARREATLLRERTQAENVNAWAERRTSSGRRVIVQNGSDKLVRDLRLWLVTPKFPAPAGDAIPVRDPTTSRAVLPAREEYEHEIASSRLGPSPAKRPAVLLVFRDAEGRTWLRRESGELVKLSA